MKAELLKSWEGKGFELLQGDCLDVMKSIPDNSVDMVLADPPYGTTACKWDSVIDLGRMWQQLKRVTKENGAIVMTASQLFTTTLIASNMKMFKYCWVWDKVNLNTGALLANKRPMKRHEDVVIFGDKQPVYNKQPTSISPVVGGNRGGHGEHIGSGVVHSDNRRNKEKNPCSVISIKGMNGDGNYHPTQKPVLLMEYLIKTYTNENETVLDFTMGSGTTGVACKDLNRNFIGIEMNEKYFEIAKGRIGNAGETK